MDKTVFIATPSFDGKVCCEYKNSVLESADLCRQNGIGFMSEDVMHVSDLEVARSFLFEKFRQSNATDLFWIDADGGWPAADFLRLLLSPKDIICGLMAKKIPDCEDYPVVYNDNLDGTPIMDELDGTISIKSIGLAFMRITRGATEKMVKSYWFPGHALRLFERTASSLANLPYGEDYSFCKKWTDIGGKIWLDPNIDTVHVGTYRWKGNYHEYLRARR